MCIVDPAFRKGVEFILPQYQGLDSNKNENETWSSRDPDQN